MSKFNSDAATSGLRGSLNEPIAIIGLGCRFPGESNDWRSYWRNLEQGVDSIGETPAERWNSQKFYAAGSAMPGKTQSRWGGYVSGIDQFDPQLFRIAPREAARMDPQQRMLLEVAYRAAEDAGQPLAGLAGRNVSVFVGISSFDYAVAGLSFRDRGVIDAYSNTGGSSSIAANRISYCFDLRGPSVAVDTACSSSLVAVHMACESIWRGEAEMALAGGVNALILPDFYVAFSQLGVLSPDGRCKTFDARANGYVRSEGAGMAMLKPLSRALLDNDPVYAVIRSTALNQDGRTPGMTVPSLAAQEVLIRTACEKAAVEPSQIQYVEAHGTGTAVGDPIEAGALGRVLGPGRAAGEACWLGSVKTNIGHLEAGAGIASLIKVALALHHQTIPAHLHFQQANPEIDFEALKLRIPTQTQPWTSQGSRLAGVNGFGYGGANAHIIMEQAPEQAWRATADAFTSAGPRRSQAVPTEHDAFVAPVLLPLSARSKPALAALADDFADRLEHAAGEVHLAEVAGYAAHRRTHHNQRTTACALTREEMIAELRTIAASSPEEFVDELSAAKLAAGVAFVCSGQGPQWWAMGRGLLKYSPAFRSVIKQCDREFLRYGDWSLMQELRRDEAESQMQKTSIAQPAIFAIQVALAAVWESWGIKPAVLVGHSVGEIAAAHLAGALDFEDACCVAFHRGRTMDLASSEGGMLAAGLSAEEVGSWIEGMQEHVSLAAINGPSSVTISGAKDHIEALAVRLEEQGIFCRRLAVEYAFHSPQMEPVREELLAALAHIQPQATHTTLISTVTGLVIDGQQVGADYWWQNVRYAVRFSDAMVSLADQGVGVAIEVGPHPVLAYSINECFAAAGYSIRTVASLNRQQDDLHVITKSLGSLYALGLNINWPGFYNKPTRRMQLPSYPFQLTRCWSESFESQQTRSAESIHPLLGERADGEAIGWQQRIDTKLQSFLNDHRARGVVMYPAAAVLDAAIAASMDVTESTTAHLRRVRLHNPCALDENRPQWIETTYLPDRRQLAFAFRECDSADWRPLATIDTSNSMPAGVQFAFGEATQQAELRCQEAFDANRLYDYCNEIGLQYGPDFRGVTGGSRCDGEVVAQIELASGLLQGPDPQAHRFHPALLDSCFHCMIAADPNFDHTVDGLYLPAEIDEFIYFGQPTNKLTVHCRLVSKTRKAMVCDLDVYDAEGNQCVSIRGFTSRRIGVIDSQATTTDLLYSYSWQSATLPPPETLEPGAPANWLILMDEGNLGKELAQRLLERGDHVYEVYRHVSHVAKTTTSKFYLVDPESPGSFSEMLQAVDQESQGQLAGVVYLWGLDAPEPHLLTVGKLEESTVLTSLAPMHFVQAWEQLLEENVASSSDLSQAGLANAGPTNTVPFSVVTTGAQSTDARAEMLSVAQGPLIGMGRVIVSEIASLSTKLVDLPSMPATPDVENLVSELLVDDDEDEILWREGHRYVRRFSPQADKDLTQDAIEALQCQLQVGKSAGIEELNYRTKPQQELPVGRVEIEVYATALNFSDVMKALDLYPGLEDGPVDLGAECSGRISRVAEGSRWNVGDLVVAIAPGSFATHVIVDEQLVALKPSNLTHDQAAAIPIAFLTADYALRHCARLSDGDSVLVHSASGGVGLAALQLAKLSRIRVFATAGSDEKRDYVRRAGAELVMDSRSLDFGRETLAATDGEGVDAVLNSLPGEAITEGLRVLKVGGRFLEIGKRDIYGDSPLGLYPFRNNLAMYAIDLDQLFKQRPQQMGAMLRDLMARFAADELQPLPTKPYDSSEVNAAFKFMQQGKHIGKVIVRYNQRPQAVRAGEYHPVRLSSDGTYWVAGGLGGFGLEITRWLVKCGVRSVVLSGRSTKVAPHAQQVIEELQAQGATVTVIPADITQPADVQQVLKRIDSQLPKLVGVLHTAMVLEDKMLVDLDRATLERVLRPKVLGGWNLHQQTLGRELECFMMFSSLSSVFGHAGQANYSAANALLDSLAYYRRAQGLPALVINWGHVGEVGYLAERQELGQRLERQGVLSFTVQQATDCLEYALQTKAIQLSVLRNDWRVWRGLGITNRVPPRFADLLIYDSNESGQAGSQLATAAKLRSAHAEERLGLVDQALRSKTASLLGIPVAQISADRALLEMGLDSLMAVEMRNWIESHMEIPLPISSLMRNESFAELSSQISETIGGLASPPVSGARAAETPQTTTRAEATVDHMQPQAAEEILSHLSELGDDQVSELLGQLLREKD